MPSYKYKVYRFKYESDYNQDFIREQRIYINSIGEDIIPVTQTFLENVVSLPENQKKIKAEKFNNKERLSEVTYKNQLGSIVKTKRYIPSRLPNKIKTQLREIKDLAGVLCLDFQGESRDYNKGLFI